MPASVVFVARSFVGFKKEESYTRAEISAELGGSVQTYLPTKNGEITCVCLGLSDNPDAPGVVLVGSRPRVFRNGQQLAERQAPVPVFLKHGPGDWRYAGLFKTTGATADPGTIRAHEEKAGRSGVRMVVYLEELSPL